MNRQEAIDILSTHYEPDDQRLVQAFDMAIEALKEPHWIPCKERLPKEEDMYQPPKHRYLCQLHRRDMMLVLARLRNIGSPMAAFWDWYGKNVPDKDVIAWMPLPEPFKEEES